MSRDVKTKESYLPVVRIEAALHERFKEIARQEHRTIAQEIRRLVEMRIAEFDNERAAA